MERYDQFRSDPAVAGVFRRVELLPNPPEPGWWGQQIHRIRQDAYFVTRYRHPSYYREQCRTIRELIIQDNIDLIFVDTLMMAQYIQTLDVRPPAIIDLHDCATMLLYRTMKMEKRWMRKLAFYSSMLSFSRWEKTLGRDFSVIVTNSEVDRLFLEKLDPSANTLTIVNGVDSEYFSPGECAPDYSRLIFTGVMDYGPNEDAAIYFTESILPIIQKEKSAVEFWIVGKDPTGNVTALSQKAGVNITGGVADVRPYIKSAGIFVCPLRYGAGIKNKVLAALAMGKAVVATSLSIEGLSLVDNEHLLIADDPGEFAAKVMQLIDDQGYAKELGERGMSLVRNRYSWRSSVRSLQDAMDGIMRDRPPG